MVGRNEAKEWAKEHLKGLFASPPAPFNDEFLLDEMGVAVNTERMIDVGGAGIGFGFPAGAT
tara:strand:- start:1115 stop:1300 length:186 start_codon:yes stop_codon:yes gene_type:complete